MTDGMEERARTEAELLWNEGFGRREPWVRYTAAILTAFAKGEVERAIQEALNEVSAARGHYKNNTALAALERADRNIRALQSKESGQ